MKKIINITFLMLLVCMVSSCLKAGLDDLPTYGDAEITNLNFEYRWWDESGKQMRVKTLTTNKEITDNVITCTITVPAASGTFTESIRNAVSLSNIVGYVDLSTAARIKPQGDAPALGAPADFSQREYTYLVTAGDGTTKEWTIKITDFKK